MSGGGGIDDAPVGLPDPTEPDPAMPVTGEDAVASMTKEVETDDMSDPMAR